VVALEHSNEWQQEQALFFDQRFRLLERHDFDDINVLLYDLEQAQARSYGLAAGKAIR
jgi:hypothetical protein